MRQLNPWLVILWATALVACGHGAPSPGDADSAADTAEIDTLDDGSSSDGTSDGDVGSEEDVADAREDGGAGQGSGDVTDTVEDTGGPYQTLGCECARDADCLSGCCLDVPGATTGVCSELCGEVCSDPAFDCRLLVNSDGDAVRLCVPIENPYCEPCETATDCGDLGVACAQLVDGSRACLTPCDDDTLCPSGSTCSVLTSGTDTGSYCTPDAGLCDGCLDRDGDLHGVGPDCLGPDDDDEDDTVYDGAPELCDGLDNDGDDEVDEGFDLTTDVEHCGACGNACAVDGGAAECVDGACVVTACPDGFEDCDGDVANGCETDVTDPLRCGTCMLPEGAPGAACGTCDTGAIQRAAMMGTRRAKATSVTRH